VTAEATTPPGLDLAVERPILKRLERWLGLAVAVPAGLAVLLEVSILLYGVTSRFVFNNPLVWGDELAGIVFLWLAMLGSVRALWNGEHMRLTTIASRLPPRLRALADTLAVAAPCLFLAMIIGPALDFMEDQSFVQTPALGWPDSVRAAAVPTGCALMLILCVLRLLQHRVREVLACCAVLAAIAAGLWITAGPIMAMGNLNLLVFFVLLLGAGVLIGVPIAFAFGLATMAALLTTTTTPLAVLPGRIDEGMSSLILLAVPLFIMLGRLIGIDEDRLKNSTPPLRTWPSRSVSEPSWFAGNRGREIKAGLGERPGPYSSRPR
jgi:TRAP-type C4-dicarboxylate transport system permease small subunit